MPHSHPSFPVARRFGYLLTLVAMTAGCSKESVKQALDSAASKTKELAAPVVEKIEAQLPESGEVTLQMTPPAKIDGAAVEIIPLGPGRDNVIQILTYDPDSSEYPRLMLHGTTTAAGAADLSGRSLELDMYFQASASAPIAISPPDRPASVTFDRFDTENQTLHGSLGPVELTGADGKPVEVRSGTLVAIIKRKGN